MSGVWTTSTKRLQRKRRQLKRRRETTTSLLSLFLSLSTNCEIEFLEASERLWEIMKVEADVGKPYYPTFASAFRPELEFQSRNSRRTYRPSDASDVINALLNYGFSILYSEVAKQLNALGLDCY